MRRAIYRHTAGGIVVHKKTGMIAIVQQPNNVWSMPKGGIESHEDPLTAARREIFEETGITEAHLVKELGKYKRFKIGKYRRDDESVIKDIRMYLFTTDQDTLTPFDKKHPEARWVDRMEAYKMLTHPKDKAFYKKHFKDLPPALDESRPSGEKPQPEK